MRSKRLRIVALTLSFAAALFILSCQQAKVAEFRKYANDADVPRISIEDAKKDADAGQAIIVDSRAEGAYQAEHITGSINIPMGSPDDKFNSLPKDKKIIVYCS